MFAFLAGLLGYYTVANLMRQEALFLSFPMENKSHYFLGNKSEGDTGKVE